MVNKFIVLHI